MENPLFSDVPRLNKEEEGQLLSAYLLGDMEAFGTIIHAYSPYINKIISKQNLYPSVCPEAVFSDVVMRCMTNLKNYNPKSSSLSSFIYGLVHQCCLLANRASYKDSDGTPVPELAIDGDSKIDEVVEEIKFLVNSVPESEMSEKARQAASLMLKGHGAASVGSIMGLTRKKARKLVEDVRAHIAWLMVDAGQSAEPFIADAELEELASRHEDSTWL